MANLNSNSNRYKYADYSSSNRIFLKKYCPLHLACPVTAKKASISTSPPSGTRSRQSASNSRDSPPRKERSGLKFTK